jgi:hypothetical protein
VCAPVPSAARSPPTSADESPPERDDVCSWLFALWADEHQAPAPAADRLRLQGAPHLIAPASLARGGYCQRLPIQT